MKRFLAIALAATVGLFAYAGSASALSVGDYGAGTAANGIAGSRHNLGGFSEHIASDGTTEICVFCHAPHHGGTHAPLWNKGVPTGFTSYGTTLAGTPVGAPGGATLACLSCHDGVSTFDTLINAPGKGNGGGNNKNVVNFNWGFFDPTIGGTAVPDTMASTRLNLGQDLRDDHPVSVDYISPRASLRATGTDIATIDLTAGLAGTNDNISQNKWAIGGFVSDSATIADLLRSGKVECSSCHDPHFSNKSWDEVESTWGGEVHADGMFLRRVGGNTGSGVCRTCHNK